MPHEGEDNPEVLFEQLRESILGQLDELVAEAEDAIEDQGGGVLPEGEETAQLWEELRERYAATAVEFERRKDAIDEATQARLASDLQDLKTRAEKVFGTSLG